MGAELVAGDGAERPAHPDGRQQARRVRCRQRVTSDVRVELRLEGVGHAVSVRGRHAGTAYRQVVAEIG